MTTILDPTDEREPVTRSIATRKGELGGVLALLDIRKPRGNVLLDRLEARLGEALPDVTIRRYTKPTFTKPCPDALRATIREECDYVIEALAD